MRELLATDSLGCDSTAQDKAQTQDLIEAQMHLAALVKGAAREWRLKALPSVCASLDGITTQGIGR